MSKISIGSRLMLRVSLQGKVKGGPLVDLRMGPDPSAMSRNDSMDDRESHSGPLIVFGPMKPLEDPECLVDIFHIEPNAIVLDIVCAETARLLSLVPDVNDGVRPCPRKFQRIVQQIHEDLLDQSRVG